MGVLTVHWRKTLYDGKRIPRIRRSVAAAMLALAVVSPPPASDASTTGRLDPQAVLERSEAAIGRPVGDYTLTDSKGEPLALTAFRGRPLVVSLVYTSCASVCPVTTQRMIEAVSAARGALGAESFAVLTFGFDARRDTPAQLAAFARAQGIDLPDWRLASADAGTVSAVLRDLGFSFDAVAGGFQHITQTTILDAEGRVYRHVYGDAFPDQVFIEPLKELVFGTSVRSISVHDLVDRIKFICTVYNPATGAYEYDYAIGFGIVLGGLSLILTGLVVFRLWRGNRRLLAARMANQDGQG